MWRTWFTTIKLPSCKVFFINFYIFHRRGLKLTKMLLDLHSTSSKFSFCPPAMWEVSLRVAQSGWTETSMDPHSKRPVLEYDVSLYIACLRILQSGDVELNPGPEKKYRVSVESSSIFPILLNSTVMYHYSVCTLEKSASSEMNKKHFYDR